MRYSTGYIVFRLRKRNGDAESDHHRRRRKCGSAENVEGFVLTVNTGDYFLDGDGPRPPEPEPVLVEEDEDETPEE
jgi:hypothetical protein